MARKKYDRRLIIGYAFLNAWGEIMTYGWEERVQTYSSPLLNMREKKGFNILGNGRCITLDDIDDVNLLIDDAPPMVHDAVHYYFRRDNIYGSTKAMRDVAALLSSMYAQKYNEGACRRDIDSMAFVIYGRMLNKLPGKNTTNS